MYVHIYNTHVGFLLKVGSHISQARLKLSMLSWKTLEFFCIGAGGVTQQLRILTSLSEALLSIPSSHMEAYTCL